ncbi:MAG: phosphoribosyl-ATP diphosphatase [Alphaproteobacteria bacterium]|nr:phosphoribosyl-ATP diphosphatase [Alphaproteobacteria bacterium]
MDQSHPIDLLYARLESRRSAGTGQSYTASLLAKGKTECARKVGEEAIETVIAVTTHDRTAVVKESADLLYHLLVLWLACEIRPAEIYAELATRESQSGLQEKAARRT